MIAIKLVLQFLGAFAVGGSVITGAAYKINLDIELEKTIAAETQELTIINTVLKTTEQDLLNVKNQISIEEGKKISIQQQNTELNNAAEILEAEIKELVKEISAIDDEIIKKNTALSTAFNAEKSTKDLLNTAEQEFNKEVEALNLANNDLTTKTKNLNDALALKTNKLSLKKTAEDKKKEDDSAVTTLETALVVEKETATVAKGAHDSEKNKNPIPDCVVDSSAAKDGESENPCVPQTITEEQKANYQDSATLTSLAASESSANEKVTETEKKIVETKATQTESCKAFEKAKTESETADSDWETLNQAKTAADTEVKRISTLKDTAEKNKATATTNWNTATLEYATAVGELKKETDKKKEKEEDKKNKEKTLEKNKNDLSLKNTEIQNIDSEIAKAKTQQTALTSKFESQKQQKTELTKGLDSLSVKTTEN